jgi:hypothetical protein
MYQVHIVTRQRKTLKQLCGLFSLKVERHGFQQTYVPRHGFQQTYVPGHGFQQTYVPGHGFHYICL